MKKIIAIVMAVVMMMAVAVPAFAADITESSPTPDATTGAQTGTADVYTTFDENTDWSYTVTIPASVSVDWNDTSAKAMTYTVESQLLIGASLKISASADNNGTMTATGTTDTLAFEVTGGDEVVFGAVNAVGTTAPGATNGENVKVAISDFSGKAVGAYSGTLTYTVVYVAPATSA